MNQDPPPPGDPNLKPTEPEIDVQEQARRRIAAREKKLAEIIEREAKRQQEIKDKEARAAEKQKESQKILKMFKDGSESSNCPPIYLKKARDASPDDNQQESWEERRISYYQKQTEMKEQNNEAASSSAGQSAAANQKPEAMEGTNKDADSGSSSLSAQVITPPERLSTEALEKKEKEKERDDTKAETEKRPTQIPPAAGSPPSKDSLPTDLIPPTTDRIARRRIREQQLSSRCLDSSEDESETAEVAPAAPKRKSDVVRKRAAPPDSDDN
ncbi:hypothetical protein GCK72_022230 [Caenorhabditis remanei]|uniref:Uncharacterized protein n=1 Tax=Caenorhabditis remanei TaxID=31234 RepID=A0A6A5FTA2_CAERE|nr:hypothetical protein GCK72_022230 [Caenorhabditis remanei]KAF1745783.1 hypothetical protein GCK72_022230 [Caenorhabditis remanei]